MLVNLKKLRTRSKNRVSKGIYEMRSYYGFNFDAYLRRHNVEFFDEYTPIVNDNERFIMPYGVCDNYQQILDYIPELVTSKDKFVIGLTKVKKSEQVRYGYGGWRWKKWGKYIGTKKPICEYLSEEKDIDEVYCYRIYKVK